MSILPSGPDGFITGKAAESLDRIASEIAVLKAIHADTTATLKQLTSITRSLSGPTPAAPPNQRQPAQRAPLAAPRAPVAPRDPTPRPTGSPSAQSGRVRDESGRWRGRTPSPSPSPDAGPARSNEGGRVSAAMSNAGDSLKGAGHSIASSADGLDPTVQAVKEISGIFSPLAAMLKPMGRLFGMAKRPEQKNQRENVTWYRRIWSAVKNPAGGSGGTGMIMTALLSMLGMLLSPIKALGRLLGMGSLAKLLGGAAGGLSGRGARNSHSKLGSAAPATADGKRKPGTAVPAGGAKEAGAKAASGKGMLGKAAGFGKGLLKRIPFIGAALGLGLAASSAMEADDPNLSADENKKDRYGSVGSGIGGVVGGVVGLLGGPAGAVAGAMIGDQLGGMVGEWLATVDLASLPGKIGDAFTSLKDGALEAAKGAFDSVKSTWSGLVESSLKIFSGMADWAKNTWKAATETVLGIKDTMADKVQTAKDYVGDKAASVKDEAQNVVYKASSGRLGAGGSDGRKAELIKAMDAGGITDQKSKAMFMANVDHETGGFTKSEENLDYSAKRLQEVFPKYYSTPEAARADAGNPEAIANKVYGNRMGNTDAGDGFKYRARGDIQLTGKAQYAEMGKKLGIDLVNNPDLAMDPKYSPQIAVQKWKSSGADRAAMAGDQVRARKLTNGGTNGLDDVTSKYDGYLAQAKAGDLTPTRRADQGKVQAPEATNAALASTMSAVKGAPAVGVMPVGPRETVAPALQGAQTVGVMAPTVPAIGMTSVKPISAGTMVAPSYSPPAADASLLKIAPTPAVEKPLMTPGKAAAAPSVQFSVPLTQNMEDRQIAHVASGGIGMD